VYISAYLILQFICIQQIMPFYRFGLLHNKTEYKNLLHFSIWPWLQTLIIIFTFQTDRFWVAMFAGLKEVSSYGLVSTMFNHIHIIFTAMALWMMPRIAAMTSRGEDPSNLYQKVRGVLFGIILGSLVVFYIVSPLLFQFWVGAVTYNYMKPYIGAFVGFEIVFAHTILPFFYLNSAGKERIATYLTFFYCMITYTCMLGGLYLFRDTVAMVQGMTVALCITMPVLNAIVQHIMHGTWSWKRALLEMLPMYAGILIIYASNWWMSSILAVIMCVLLWKFYLSNVFKGGLWKQFV
jgi:O-antigen/teichoic acid export membrane protein